MIEKELFGNTFNNDNISPFLVYGDSDVITNPDDLLPPIAKLEKYAESDNIFNRSVILNVLTLRIKLC